MSRSTLNVVITFSENVNRATANAFSIVCNGATQSFTPTSLSTVAAANARSLTRTWSAGASCNGDRRVAWRGDRHRHVTDPPDQMPGERDVLAFTTEGVRRAVTATNPADGVDAGVSGSTRIVVITFNDRQVASFSRRGRVDVRCPTGFRRQSTAKCVSGECVHALTPTTPRPGGDELYRDGSTPRSVHRHRYERSAGWDGGGLRSRSRRRARRRQCAGNVVINSSTRTRRARHGGVRRALRRRRRQHAARRPGRRLLQRQQRSLSYAAFDLDGDSTNVQLATSRSETRLCPGVDLVFAPGSRAAAERRRRARVSAGNASDFPDRHAPSRTDQSPDAIVYDTDDADDPGLLALLNRRAAAGRMKRRRQRHGRSRASAALTARAAPATRRPYLQGTPTPGGEQLPCHRRRRTTAPS